MRAGEVNWWLRREGRQGRQAGRGMAAAKVGWMPGGAASLRG